MVIATFSRRSGSDGTPHGARSPGLLRFMAVFERGLPRVLLEGPRANLRSEGGRLLAGDCALGQGGPPDPKKPGARAMGMRVATVGVVRSGLGRRTDSPRLRLGLPDGRHAARMIEPILDREEPVGGTRRRRGIFATHEQFPSRPPEHPVAKSPGGEHVTAGEPIRYQIDASRIPRACDWGFLTEGTGVGERSRSVGRILAKGDNPQDRAAATFAAPEPAIPCQSLLRRHLREHVGDRLQAVVDLSQERQLRGNEVKMGMPLPPPPPSRFLGNRPCRAR